MTHICARRARALLGTLLATAALLAAIATPALADLDVAGVDEIPVDTTGHWWNGLKAVTHGSYQYMAYWDAPDGAGDVYVTLVRRDIAGRTNEFTRFDAGHAWPERLVNVNDGHDVVTIGLSPNDGRIHISTSVHSGYHHYGISDAGCLSAARLSDCTFRWEDFQTGAQDITNDGRTRDWNEDHLTYPYYFNDADGKLYFSYRFGQSSRGNVYINQYQDDGTWRDRGLVIKGRFETIDWAGTRGTCTRAGTPSNSTTACHRGVYTTGIEFDRRDRLHMAWIYKEYTGGAGHGGYENRGLYYMYSDDYGDNWYDSANNHVATAGSAPLLPTNTSTEIVSLPFGWDPFLSWIRIDSNDVPHVVLSASDTLIRDNDLRDVNKRLMHVWPTGDTEDDGRRRGWDSWSNSWIEPAGDKAELVFGALAFDAADNAYYIYNDNDLDWAPFNNHIYQQRELPQGNVTWQGGEYLDVQQASATTCVVAGGYHDGTAVRSGGNDRVRINVNNNTDATTMTLDYNTTTGSGGGIVASVTANDRTTYRTYTFDLSREANWAGTLVNLRLCMDDARADVGDQFRLDYVRVTNSAGTAARSWEFRSGNSVKYAYASGRDNWASWTIADLLTGFSMGIGDSAVYVDPQYYANNRRFSIPLNEQATAGVQGPAIWEFDVNGDTIAKEWQFPADSQGWYQDRTIPSFAWANDGGTLGVGGTLTTSGSAISSGYNLGVPLGANRIELIMKHTTSATQGNIWYITNASTRWSIARTVTFTLSRAGGYQRYDIDMSRARDWSGGTLYQLALEPTVGATSGTFNVDRLTIRRP